jgi:hypothetical protein
MTTAARLEVTASSRRSSRIARTCDQQELTVTFYLDDDLTRSVVLSH